MHLFPHFNTHNDMYPNQHLCHSCHFEDLIIICFSHHPTCSITAKSFWTHAYLPATSLGPCVWQTLNKEVLNKIYESRM